MDSSMTRLLGASQSNLANVDCSVRIIELPSDEIPLAEPANCPAATNYCHRGSATWNGDNEKMN